MTAINFFILISGIWLPCLNYYLVTGIDCTAGKNRVDLVNKVNLRSPGGTPINSEEQNLHIRKMLFLIKIPLRFKIKERYLKFYNNRESWTKPY